jgi:hypothetical protein
MFLWGDACARLRVRGRAAELYELLAPHAGLIACAGGAIVLGPIAWVLGALAASLERYEDAEQHFSTAAAIDRRLGAPLFAARTHISWARMLIARGRTDDRGRAEQMLEEVAERAERVGSEHLLSEVAECREAIVGRAWADDRFSVGERNRH